jgi:hypothetical protein
MPDNNFALIPHTQITSLFMLKTPAGWTLPRHTANEAPALNQAMRDQLGLEVILLRVAYDHYHDEEREEQHIVYEFENLTPGWTLPECGAWIEFEELPGLELAFPEHRAVLTNWFVEQAKGQIPAQRIPWARAGWYTQATAWIVQQLDTLSYQLRAPIEQLHVRVWSCVLRVPTTSGDLYFKAGASVFAFEPVLTAGLAELWPEYLPTVLAVDAGRAWMLLADAGPTLRRSEQRKELTTWERMLDLFAHLQIATVAQQEKLLTLGCPDRRLETLPALFSELISQRSAMLIGEKEGLREAEYQSLLAMEGEVRAICVELASYGIPEALHHDDFHDGNILLKAGKFIFFDWAECALTHPFFTMIIVLRYTKHVFGYDESQLACLRDAYLAPWQDYASKERLLRAFELAQRLGLLCRALTWHQTVQHLEEADQWAYASSIPWNLRSFLSYPRDLLLKE